jgi:hypothetical protein
MSKQEPRGNVDAIEKLRLEMEEVQEQKKRLDVLALKLIKGTLYTMIKDISRIVKDRQEYDKYGSLRVAYIGNILCHALEHITATIDGMEKGDSNDSGTK